MDIQIHLSSPELKTLEMLLSNKIGAMEVTHFGLLPLMVYTPSISAGVVTIKLSEQQTRIYKNKGSDFNFLYKWKHTAL